MTSASPSLGLKLEELDDASELELLSDESDESRTWMTSSADAAEAVPDGCWGLGFTSKCGQDDEEGFVRDESETFSFGVLGGFRSRDGDDFGWAADAGFCGADCDGFLFISATMGLW